MRLELKDSSVIQIADSFGIGDLIAVYVHMSEMTADVEKCTEENCSSMKLISDDGEVMAEYTDLVFSGVTTEPSSEPGVTIEAHYHFRRKTAEEKMMQMISALQERVDLMDGAIEDLAIGVSDLSESQDLQDGAIEDLAEAISDM